MFAENTPSEKLRKSGTFCEKQNLTYSCNRLAQFPSHKSTQTAPSPKPQRSAKTHRIYSAKNFSVNSTSKSPSDFTTSIIA